MSERLVKLSRDEQTLLAKPQKELDRRVVPELERDVLELDDWIARQRVEEMLALADEIQQHKARLKDLLGTTVTDGQLQSVIDGLTAVSVKIDAAAADVAGPNTP